MNLEVISRPRNLGERYFSLSIANVLSLFGRIVEITSLEDRGFGFNACKILRTEAVPVCY